MLTEPDSTGRTVLSKLTRFLAKGNLCKVRAFNLHATGSGAS